jgi:hypothetical protein
VQGSVASGNNPLGNQVFGKKQNQAQKKYKRSILQFGAWANILDRCLFKKQKPFSAAKKIDADRLTVF